MTLPRSGAAHLCVALAGAVGPKDLCRLANTSDRRTALEWTPEALRDGDDAGADLVVRQAPCVPGVHVTGKPALHGLPGFIADSLPDSWGRLLLDRQLRKLGVEPAALSVVDRLAVVGDRGPGALTFRPDFPLSAESDERLDLDRLARDAEVVLAGETPELLEVLERAGGSAGGSRPKAWLAVDPAGRLRSGAGPLLPGETGWLVKFRAPEHDPEDIGPLEYAYAAMAAAAGLEVAEPRLFETARGRYFASRRFDRAGARRVHVLTAAGLLDVAAHEALAADYSDLLKLTRHVTRSEAEVREAYRHAVFNVLSHNRDDHLKQFAFRRAGGEWTRTPAYDLTFAPGPGGEHTLLVAGEGRHPTGAHLERVAQAAGLDARVARRVLAEVRAATARWTEFASAAGVGARSTDRVGEAIRRLAAACV